jgi:UDP-3-O-[3-hydroxymyristoyl] glucosamine N-acyltransferase
MQFKYPIPVSALAKRFQAQVIGDETLMATGINEIHKVQPGDIAFSDAPKYFQKTIDSAATVLLLNAPAECPVGKVILVVPDPFTVYNTLVLEERPPAFLSDLRSPTADIHPSAVLEPGVVVAHDVSIGPNCRIQANTVIGPHTIIGEGVIIGANCHISSDAFYFKKHSDGSFQPWRSGGRTIIENFVQIGAGCTIAQGVSGDTIIGEGSKLDCQIHIGHGAVIGKHCLMAAQVGIGGKTVIGDHVTLYGQVGVAQAIEIGAHAVVLAKSGVSKSLAGAKTYFGIPAEEARAKYKELATLRRLSE